MSGELAGRESAREVPALSGVFLKIDRGRAHLADFDARVRPLEAECRNAIVGERDERNSQYVFRFDHLPAIPPDLTTIIGDAVHNLRVSLDYLAWQLVKVTGGTPTAGPGGTSFPIWEARSKPKPGELPYPQIKPCVPESVREMLDQVQPYQREYPANYDLAVLSNLDIKDKHHELLIAIFGVESAASFLRGADLVGGMNTGPYEDGTEVARFTYPTDGSENPLGVSFMTVVRFIEPAAGALGTSIGASRVVRNSLGYVEDKVLPRFRGFF